jgi:hypothetical protein
MKPKLIVIDGKTYNSVAEMPEEVRRNYERAMSQFADKDGNGMPDAFDNLNALTDKNRDGIPDAFEGMVSNLAASSARIIVDGTVYNSIDELPPDIRARYDQAVGSMDANRNGVPDFLEGMINTANQTLNAETGFETEAPRQPSYNTARSNPLPVSPTITPDTSNGLMLALAGVFLLVLCAAGVFGIWFFFIR